MNIRGRNIKKIFAVIMIFVMVFALAACGNKEGGNSNSGSGSAEPANSAGKSMEEVLLNASKNMENAKSMTYTFDMDMGMQVFGMKMDTLMKSDIKTIQNPLTLEMTGKMDMGEMGSYDMDIYAETEGDHLVMYTGMNMGEETMWMKSSVDMDSSQISQYNAQSNIKVYMENAKNFTEVGKEDVNGVQAVRFDGVINGDSIGNVLNESGMSEQVSGMGVENPEEMFAEMGDIPVSFWVDTEKELIVKYTIDMSEAMQKLMAKTMEEMETSEEEGTENMAGLFTIDRSVMTIVITGIDNVDSITIPQEAKDNAEEM